MVLNLDTGKGPYPKYLSLRKVLAFVLTLTKEIVNWLSTLAKGCDPENCADPGPKNRFFKMYDIIIFSSSTITLPLGVSLRNRVVKNLSIKTKAFFP